MVESSMVANTNLALLLFLAVTVLLVSLWTLYKALSTVLQVSNGYSLLDDDASPGLRLRKRFLLFFLTPSSLARVFAVVLELMLLLSTGQRSVDEHWLSVFWTLRLAPSLFYLATTVYLAHYLFGILTSFYYTGGVSQPSSSEAGQGLWGKLSKWCESRAEEIIAFLRYLFLTVLSVMLVVGGFCLFRVNVNIQHHSPSTPESLIVEHKVLALCAALLFLVLAFCSVLLHRSLLSGGSSNSTLSNATAPLRILSRFLLLVSAMAAGCLATFAFHTYVAISLRQQYSSSDSINVRETLYSLVFGFGVAQQLVILFAEGLTSFAAVQIITNQATAIEDYLRKTCLVRTGRKVAFSTSSTNVSNQAGVGMVSVTSSLLGGSKPSGDHNAPPPSSDSSHGLKNYQSIV